jgi:hypothetical protein
MVYSACGTITTFGTTLGKTMQIGGSTPVITQQPVATATCPAGPAEVSIAASGSSLVYRWDVRNLAAVGGWSTITDGPVLIGDAQVAVASGATTATLSLTDFHSGWRSSSTNSGRAVRCVIANSCPNSTTVTSSTALISLCQGDLNCDGGVDGSDIVTFFGLWENGDAGADINDDGGIDGADVAAYFPIWEAGC